MRTLAMLLAFAGLVWAAAALVRSCQTLAVDMRDVPGDAVCEKCDKPIGHPHGVVWTFGMSVALTGGTR
jgi:hypothetical protein